MIYMSKINVSPTFICLTLATQNMIFGIKYRLDSSNLMSSYKSNSIGKNVPFYGVWGHWGMGMGNFNRK